MTDLSSVFRSAFKNVFTECEGCKHYEKHIEMIARESKEPCKYCSRHYYDKFEEDRRMTREEAIELLCAYGVPQDEKRFQVALDKAIEALNREQQIIENGYTGKEMRIRIGGRLFAVRELAQ